MRKIREILVISTIFILSLWLASCAQKQSEETLIAKARKIHEKVLTVDSHCDTPMFMAHREWDMSQYHKPGIRPIGKIDLPRMAEGNLDAQFFAVYVGQGERTPEGYAEAREEAARLLDAIHQMCEDYPQLVELATTPEDAYRLEKEGKRAAFIGMENGYPIGKDLSLIKRYFDRGVRYITLCHSSDNDICDSSTDQHHPQDNGLSDFGREVVEECNRLGIMIDVSHVSDKTFFDALQVSRTPVIASHSCTRTLCDHPRNLSDKMLDALALHRGVIQICFVSSFIKKLKPNPQLLKARQELQEKYGSWSDVKDKETREKMWQEYMQIVEKYPMDKATVKDLVDHIDHVVKRIGVDHVGIGTDFDGGGDIEGCKDVSEMPHITEELVRRGYTEEEIEKIWGGNIMRILREVQEKAEKLK